MDCSGPGKPNRRTMALTEAAIKALKPTGKRQRMSDAGGLHLTVTAHVTKQWRLRCRFDGKQKDLALGAYPAVTLKMARQKAVDVRAMLNAGRDPVAERKTQKEAGRTRRLAAGLTFAKVAREWFETKAGAFSGKTRSQPQTRMEKYLLVPLGNRPFARRGPRRLWPR